MDTLRTTCTCGFLSGRKSGHEHRQSRAQRLRYDMRGSSYTPARRTAGDEHGDCAEPFRTPRGWGIHTMVVRTEVNGANHDRY